MRRPRLQSDTLRSLSKLGQTIERRSSNTLFAVPARVRAQQRRTFQWTGASATRSTATSQFKGLNAFQEPLRDFPHVEILPHQSTQPSSTSPENTQEGKKKEQHGDQVRVEEEAPGTGVNASEHLTYSSARPFKSSKDANDNVKSALIRRLAPEEILYVFVRACRTDGFLQSVHHALFKSIWEHVKPERVLALFRDAHLRLHPAALRYSGGRLVETLFDAYTQCIRAMLANPTNDKRTDRWRLKQLLKVAAVTGDAKSAQSAFDIIRNDSSMKPDTEMYNEYLKAVCWEGTYTVDRMFLRVHPWALKLREEQQSNSKWQGFRIREGGVQEEALKIIKEMQEDGCECDTETWNSLIIAMAREGDRDGIKSTLKQVWDIDVDAVMQQDESGMLFENQLTPESALFPTPDTLFAIAHAFCTNSEVAGALQVIDFASRKYEIDITRTVWKEVLEWAYVLSRPRRGRKDIARQVSMKHGSVPLSTVHEVWEIMSKEPYNVQPDAHIISIVYHTAIRRQDYVGALDILLQANKIAFRNSAKRKEKTEQAPLRGHTATQPAEGPLSIELSTIQNLEDATTVSRMVRTLLSQRMTRGNRGFSNSRFKNGWHRRVIPNVLYQCRWAQRNPRCAYSLPSGRISFHLRDPSTIVLSRVGHHKGQYLVHQTWPMAGRDSTGEVTRQQRLQMKYVKSGRKSQPKYQPQWFETDNIKIWQPEPATTHVL